MRWTVDRRVLRRLAGFEVLEDGVTLLGQFGWKFAGQLRAQDVGSGSAGAGDGDEAAGIAALFSTIRSSKR